MRHAVVPGMANPIDVMVSKAKGMEKSMEARRDGLVGVFQTLAKQHGEAAALIDRVKEDSLKRESLWPKIKVALVSHEKGELKAVYPELAKHDALKPFVAQHAKEADELSAMIDRLDTMSMDAREWGSLFGTLASTVVAHATEEENEIFPIALNAIGVDKAKELDAAFKDAQKEVETTLKKTQH
jgi:hemerythrin superfamily protein